MILQEVGGRGLLQMDIWKHSTSLDVREPHNPCFCPKIDQIDIGPERSVIRNNLKMTQQLQLFTHKHFNIEHTSPA